MAFWGIKVKPGKPYTHRFDEGQGRLHLSQATLGTCSSTKRSIVQCNVGDKRPIYLCSLLPHRFETCQLNLEFEEKDEVTFSVIGPHSIHLSGFFHGETRDPIRDNYGSDSYEEDIGETESDDSIDYDTEDEDDDDFIVDDVNMFPPSPVPNSGVVIEEIVDEEKPAIEDDKSNQEKNGNKFSISGNKKKSESDTGDLILETEDEDGFPIASPQKNKSGAVIVKGKREIIKDKRTDEEVKKKKKRSRKKEAKDDPGCVRSLRRKVDDIVEEGEQTRETGQQPDSTFANTKAVPEAEMKQEEKKKKKEKARAEVEKIHDAGTDGRTDIQSEAATMDMEQAMPVGKESNQKLTAEQNLNIGAESIAEGKKKKKREKSKKKGSNADANVDRTVSDKNGSTKQIEETTETKPFQVRSFPNGLVIEELAMGKPDGKKASPGRQVFTHYVGKLRDNSKIFDSNIDGAPFKFRLGVGQVIKGWDFGLNGMRVGDKRRLTIPPAMGYGAQGAGGGAIPPNSWLVFDVELVDVR